uniref:SLC2A4 regulator n=1 Tax=Naja naja TaxID=35670 RepID=A0A8C6X209_NAJNA
CRLAAPRGRAFSVGAPTLWNQLPLELRLAPDLRSFRCDLKTWLFLYSEMNCDVWKAAPVRSSSCSSSNHSGDGSWDPPSDFSTPSTPSPPLTEATQFLFGEPVPRKRKNSTKVMFKCLWKSCGKVLSSSSGMQKHIRAIHLGRKADLDQSDGEEDFYYTELDVNVDSLTDGLSSLTPVSPTSPVPPPFPVLEEVQKILPIPLNPKVSVVSHLSQSWSCTHQPTHVVLFPPAVGTSSLKVWESKPRGEAKKCRKVYGMENRSMWCTACRWKKACQRFVD